MQSQTNQFVTQQAALSTQVASAVTAVNSQLETAARDAASASVAANEAAESAAVAANEAATAANAAIRAEVSRTVAGLETNVTRLVATTGGTGDGGTPKNAGMTCAAIKAAFPSSGNGYFYVHNPVNLSRTHSTAHLFGEQGPGGASVLKVFCNFASEGLSATRRARSAPPEFDRDRHRSSFVPLTQSPVAPCQLPMRSPLGHCRCRWRPFPPQLRRRPD